MPQQHVFERILLQIDLNSEKDAHPTIDRLTEKLIYQTFPKLQSELDSLIPEDKFIEIDQLELELPDLRKGEFDDEFETLFKNQLSNKIRTIISQLSKNQIVDGVELKDEHGKPVKVNRFKDVKLSKIEAIQLFIKTGVLPIWADEELQKNFKVELINYVSKNINFFTQNNDSDNIFLFIKRIYNAIKDELDYNMLKSVFSINDNNLIIKNIFKLKTAFENNIGVVIPFSVINTFNNILIQEIANYYTKKANDISIKDFVGNILKGLKESNLVEANEIIFNSKNNTLKLPKKLNTFENIINNILKRINKQEFNSIEKGDFNIQSNNNINEKNNSIHDTKEIDTFFINNSGLSIISPYIIPFLNNLGHIKNNELINPEHTALLLGYLATGETEFQEFDLALNKLICGIPLGYPIATSFKPTLKEEEEVKNLLEAIIGNWKSMKGSSIEGLRETFIKREGILEPKDEHWLLKVERTGVDVLIDGLEWGFSMMRFPWNKYLIYIEW